MKKRTLKGVIVSTEVILILSAVIILTFITTLGLGRMVMNQATSEKATATINEAHVRIFKQGTSCKITSVTFYVTNLGGKKLIVERVWLTQPNGQDFAPGAFNNINKEVNPGETLPISVYVYGSCPSLNVGSNTINKVFLYVQYHIEGSNRHLVIGKPVEVEIYNG